MLELQRRLILNPDAIPEPPVDGEQIQRPIALRFAAVFGAALIAWGIVSLPGSNKADELMPTQARAMATAVNPGKPVKLLVVRPAIAAPPGSERSAAADPPASAAVPQIPSAASALAAAPAPTAAPAPAAAPAAPRLDSKDVAAMVERGTDFLMTGDLASARLLLRSAADAGSGEAALALGSTYDPLVIQRLDTMGAAADVAQARRWYQRAADLGSAAATAQLAKLQRAQ